MDNYNGNGVSDLEVFETPFADVASTRETYSPQGSAELSFENILSDFESPFTRTYEAPGEGSSVTQNAEDYVSLTAELHDEEFAETLAELAKEIEDTWAGKISNETAMGSKFIPFATQQAAQYILPLSRETEEMIDRIAQHFSSQDMAAHTDTEIEQFFSNLQFSHESYSPAQDQFFGKIFNKVKSVVKKGVDLAKKGVAAVGRLLPINIILNKIKGLVKPLLDKVLKTAIGKLPKSLQPHAQALAKKFLKMETPEFAETSTTGDFEAIQTEFDQSLAEMLFSRDEVESDNLLMSYETSTDNLERNNNYETGALNIPPLDVARQQFINELKALPPGESAAPAIERFLPAAIIALQPLIRTAIGIIGRQRVINFLAGLLAKLVSRYVPENVARPLAASIIDVGMGAIGFEVNEGNQSDLAYETIANTIQDTVQQLGSLNEQDLNDTETLSLELMEAFEKAAANHFPAQYIKPGLRRTQQGGIWILKPRIGGKPLYKKFTQVFDVNIDPRLAMAVKTFRDLPLGNFLRDKMSLDPSKVIPAKVHLYETIPGTALTNIARYENVPGFNAEQPYAWTQLHPLTETAATLLLKEPSLGVNMEKETTAKRHRTAPGQRYYLLEVNGARLRIPPVNRVTYKHSGAGKPGAMRPSQSADIQGVMNFIKSEISFNYYFSEEDAKNVVEKINKNDALGAAMAIRQSVKSVLNQMLIQNIRSKVKIIHESMPELYLENIPEEQHFSFGSIINKVKSIAAGGGKQILNSLIQKLIQQISDRAYRALAEFFKARAAEFKQAQAQPQDGVTIKITWRNVPGMSAIRAVISAIRGNFSIQQLTNLSIPSLGEPQIQVVADKKFD